MIRLIFGKGYEIEKEQDNVKYIELGEYKKTKEDDMKSLESLDSIKDYKEFLRKLECISKEKLISLYEVQFETDSFYIFRKSANDNQASLILKYTPENDTMLDLTKKIFRMDSKKTKTRCITEHQNNFNLVCSVNILNVIYTKYDILSKGEIIFNKFKLTSKNGKVRDIVAPHDDMKSVLRELNSFLQNVYDSRNTGVQIAYKKGNNVKTGALKHKDNKYVFNMDLKDFYPSCKRELVRKYTSFLFKNSYNRKFLEEEFLDTILIDDGLFIGSPISGTLANVIISKPISYLNSICKKSNITLTVYADDISFSSEKFLSEKFINEIIQEAFAKYGLDTYFSLNQKKAVGYSGSRRKITGVAINDSDEVTIPRSYYRDLRARINNLANGDTSINIQKLRGKIAYAIMIDDSGKVLKYLKKFESTVKQYSLYSGEL